MIAMPGKLQYAGPTPTLATLDVATQPLPHNAGSSHLMSMSSVLHVFDEPLPTLAEIRRVLARAASSCERLGPSAAGELICVASRDSG